MIHVSQPKRFQSGVTTIPTRGSNQTILLNTLSTFFPEGEAFFIESVRHFRKVVEKGSDLDTDISRFIGQEAFHSIAHSDLNSRLYQSGYKDVTRIVRFCLGMIFKMSPKLSLHVTAILEHYTATLARQVLDGVYVLSPEERELWVYHATEEWEHRRVSFDVLKLVGSVKASRFLFPLVSLIFFMTMAIMYVMNGGRWDYKLLVKLSWNVPELCRYMKPGFNP